MRQHGYKYLLVILLTTAIVGTSSCSSLNKNAKKFYDAGAYEDALALYDQVLEKDPDDTDAKIGRMLSREKIIDTKLLEVRRSRIAGNEQNSIEMLSKLVNQENEWGIYPKGAVAFTQEEEAQEALSFVDRKVRDALKRGRPLQAQVALDQYKAIFQGALLPSFQVTSQKVRTAGVRDCRRFASDANPSVPYYSEFVRRYCSFWDEPLREIAALNEKKYSELFKQIKFSAKIEQLPQIAIQPFEDSLKEHFSKTPWFDTKGTKELRVFLEGSFIRKTANQAATRIHEYTVSIPYTAYESQMQTKQVPYSTTEYQCVHNFKVGSICGNVPVTRYRTEYYTVMVPVTRYRSEPRTETYAGVEMYQLLGLFLKGRATFSSKPEQFTLTEKSEKAGFQHNVSMPEIGLSPQDADLPDPLEWLKAQSVALGNKLRDISEEVWRASYCRSPAHKTSLAQQGEQVHRCLRATPTETPRFIALWYQNSLGVNLSEAEKTLGLTNY